MSSRVGAWIAGHLRGSLALDEVARPQWAAGLRAATAMAVPLLLGLALGRPELSWAGLGGWLTMIADPGGPYRARAEAMIAFALAGSLATVLGGVTGHPPWLAAPALFACALFCSLLRVRGDTAASIGVLCLIEFCITQGSPAPLEAGMLRAELFASGGAFAVLLATAVWPFRPYYPVRMAVASVWNVLADLAEAAAALAAPRAGPGDWETLLPLRRRAREELERARRTLGLARAGHQGETPRGLQLLVLYEIAELLLGDLAALIEALRARAEGKEGLPAEAAGILAGLGRAQRALASSVAEEGKAPEVGLPGASLDGELSPLLQRVRGEIGQALASAKALARGGKGPSIAGPVGLHEHPPSLRDTLGRTSAELRHALRVAIVATAAGLLAAALHLHRSYWVTVTAVIVLQPHAVATVRRALQRVGGTVIGGMAAALMARYLRQPLLVGPVLFAMACCGVAIRRINYAAFAALVTPVFVLLAEASAGGAHLTRVRILNTLLGGALALLGALTLWPTRELDRMPALIAAVLRANLAYLKAILRREQPAAAARRQIGLAAANAEAALQRLTGEAPPAGRLEPLMALVALARRLSASITALASEPEDAARTGPLEEGLRALADAAEAGEAPASLPPFDESGASEPARRLAWQLRVVQSALARVAAAG